MQPLVFGGASLSLWLLWLRKSGFTPSLASWLIWHGSACSENAGAAVLPYARVLYKSRVIHRCMTLPGAMETPRLKLVVRGNDPRYYRGSFVSLAKRDGTHIIPDLYVLAAIHKLVGMGYNIAVRPARLAQNMAKRKGWMNHPHLPSPKADYRLDTQARSRRLACNGGWWLSRPFHFGGEELTANIRSEMFLRSYLRNFRR